MVSSKDVLQTVLSLPKEERAKVALRVLESLGPSDVRSSDEWLAEVERRARQALDGSSARRFDDVVAEIEADLE